MILPELDALALVPPFRLFVALAPFVVFPDKCPANISFIIANLRWVDDRTEGP